jgi:hypothetical protein
MRPLKQHSAASGCTLCLKAAATVPVMVVPQSDQQYMVYGVSS